MTRPSREPDLASGHPSPIIVESRRLMGPNLMHAGLGAVLDVVLDDASAMRNASLLRAWHARVAELTRALGWPDAVTSERVYPGGASLFVHAPVDQLMAATDVCESAWISSELAHGGPARDAAGATIDALRLLASTEACPAFVALWDEGQRRGLNVTFDERSACIGSGSGAQCWSVRDIPAIESIDWGRVRDIPIVLVTGSNGKTTVVRMVAAMARAAGHVVGHTCTDGVWIGDAQVESGDWSGPVGARRVLQDPTVTFAVLETARGGILRRGLAVQHASVAAVVTLSPDHFGDYGINDLETLAEVKLIVGSAVKDHGLLVVNAGVPSLVQATASYAGRMATVAVQHHSASEAAHPSFTWTSSRDLQLTAQELARIPATLGGSATHNVLNALIAATVAAELQLGDAARAALLRFGADTRDNMGRLMVRDVGGVTVVIDYAHNPQSVAALIDATRGISAMRRAVSLGTGGDRDDVALRAMAAAAVASGIIDLFIAKEMPKFLRGRAPGSISGELLDALRALGVPDSQVASAPDDISAVRHALTWARTGDLLLLAVHDQRDDVLQLVERCTTSGWTPGTKLP